MLCSKVLSNYRVLPGPFHDSRHNCLVLSMSHRLHGISFIIGGGGGGVGSNVQRGEKEGREGGFGMGGREVG